MRSRLCRLCGKRKASERLWGHHVCRMCRFTYEELVFQVAVNNNEYARKALRLAAKKLYGPLGMCLSTQTAYARENWEGDNDDSDSDNGQD